MNDAPRVSIVVTARNDDHGGDLLRRMQIFIDHLLEQAWRHGLDSELIVVEWNPPPDRPGLVDALQWPRQASPCRVRIIKVPAEIHRRYQYADRLGLFQMIAKNVGIRRARGRFVLSTNVDVLFSDELVRFLASGPLDDNVMYRMDRFDVPAGVPLGVPVAEQLEFCRQNVLRICARWGTFVPGEIRWIAVLKREVGKMLAWRRSAPAVPDQGRYTANSASLLSKGLKRLRRLAIHTNACGDFTLLTRERWFALRGYPELEMFSLHLDSVLCHMAFRAGAREVILGDAMRVYHIDHGSGWSPGEADRLAARMAAMDVPMVSSGQYEAWLEESRRRREPILFNDESWGLVRETLAETDPFEQRRGDGWDEPLAEEVRV